MSHSEKEDQKAKLAVTPNETTDTVFGETICRNAAEISVAFLKKLNSGKAHNNYDRKRIGVPLCGKRNIKEGSKQKLPHACHRIPRILG